MKTVESTIKTKLSDDLIAIALEKGWKYWASEDRENRICYWGEQDWKWTACFSDFMLKDLELNIIEKDGMVMIRLIDYRRFDRVLATEFLDDFNELSSIISNLYTSVKDGWEDADIPSYFYVDKLAAY